MIALIVVALLASGAGLSVPAPREAYAAVAMPRSTGERSVERAHRAAPLERDGVRRTALLRTIAPTIPRVQTPSGAGDGPRAAALRAEPSSLEPVTQHAAGPGVDVRRGHVPRPAQPAPSSRAPPIA